MVYMKWWRVAIGLFLLIGLIIAVFSLYKASVNGLLNNVGLVGSDFSVAVVQDEIRKAVLATKGKFRCDLPSRLKGTVSFMLASDQEQGQLAFRLGEGRMVCGASMLAEGDVEVGTYEILKGIGYLKQGYQFVTERAELDRRVCAGLPGGELAGTMSQILDATSGKVYEIISTEWRDLSRIREPAEAACLDHRNSVR